MCLHQEVDESYLTLSNSFYELVYSRCCFNFLANFTKWENGKGSFLCIYCPNIVVLLVRCKISLNIYRPKFAMLQIISPWIFLLDPRVAGLQEALKFLSVCPSSFGLVVSFTANIPWTPRFSQILNPL